MRGQYWRQWVDEAGGRAVAAPAVAKPKPATRGAPTRSLAATVPVPSSAGSADLPAPGDDHPMIVDSVEATERPLSD